jgi:glycosyltransferase involved in cell wall biosynthesis
MPDGQLRWIALLGRQDSPTDGVEDYCVFLGRALAEKGIELERVRVPWAEKGWTGALRQVSRECSAWRGQWILLQYTALAWSRRGFPLLAPAVAALIRRSGARVAIVFHEAQRQGGSGWRARMRGACQDWVIRNLYRGAEKALFTVPLDAVPWLPKLDDRPAFIPIGANIPEPAKLCERPLLVDRDKTVIVFGVTEMPVAIREVNEIAGIIRQASMTVANLRLVVVGRGAIEARELFAKALDGCNVKFIVRGVLPAEEISRECERADAFLFIREAITPRRGSALAGIACGIPVVGYHNGDISGPLREAGVEWSRWKDRDALVRGLIRVLSDPQRWLELHERNIAVQVKYFSWSRIAERYLTVLSE